MASCPVISEPGWRTMSARSDDQTVRYLGRMRRMDEPRLTKKLYEVGLIEDLPWRSIEKKSKWGSYARG